jgi:protease-4
MSKSQVDAIGQGRVWSGVQAKENGLVDELGGLDTALKEAAKLAKIKTYKTKDYPEFDKTFEEMLGGFGLAKAKEDILKAELSEAEYKIYQTYRQLTKQKGIQLRLPYEIKFN